VGLRPLLNTWLPVAAFAFAASGLGVAAFARWASAGRLLDLPNERSSHSRPTPRGAGAVIVAVVSLTAAWPIIVDRASLTLAATVVALSAMLIAIVSAIDDARSLGSTSRLVVHTVCATAAIVAVAGPHWAVLPAAIAVLWVVGLTNAYNFMDGIDGIAGAQAVVAGAALAVASQYAGLPAQARVALTISAASAGFLLHNWPPARVFMGDVGAAFIGFVFGAIAVQVFQTSAALALGAALSLWPFVFDTSFTFVRRAIRRENVLASHRSHLYQRLVISGWSHARVTSLYSVAAVTGGLVGLVWATERDEMSPLILLVVPAMAVAMWMLVVWRETQRSAELALKREA